MDPPGRNLTDGWGPGGRLACACCSGPDLGAPLGAQGLRGLPPPVGQAWTGCFHPAWGPQPLGSELLRGLMVCSPGVWFGPSCCGREGGPLPTSAPRAPGSTPQVSMSREAGSSDMLRRGGHKQLAHLRQPMQAIICLRVGFSAHSAQEEAKLPAASPPLGPEGGMPAREGGRCSPPSQLLCNTGGRKRQTPRGAFRSICGADALLGLEVLRWPVRAGTSTQAPLTPGEPASGRLVPATFTHLIPCAVGAQNAFPAHKNSNPDATVQQSILTQPRNSGSEAGRAHPAASVHRDGSWVTTPGGDEQAHSCSRSATPRDRGSPATPAEPVHPDLIHRAWQGGLKGPPGPPDPSSSSTGLPAPERLGNSFLVRDAELKLAEGRRDGKLHSNAVNIGLTGTCSVLAFCFSKAESSQVGLSETEPPGLHPVTEAAVSSPPYRSGERPQRLPCACSPRLSPPTDLLGILGDTLLSVLSSTWDDAPFTPQIHTQTVEHTRFFCPRMTSCLDLNVTCSGKLPGPPASQGRAACSVFLVVITPC